MASWTPAEHHILYRGMSEPVKDYLHLRGATESRRLLREAWDDLTASQRRAVDWLDRQDLDQSRPREEVDEQRLRRFGLSKGSARDRARRRKQPLVRFYAAPEDWPIGSGRTWWSVYDRRTNRMVILKERTGGWRAGEKTARRIAERLNGGDERLRVRGGRLVPELR